MNRENLTQANKILTQINTIKMRKQNSVNVSGFKEFMSVEDFKALKLSLEKTLDLYLDKTIKDLEKRLEAL